MNNEITTRDFYFSALLLTNGFQLIRSIKKNNGVHFIFNNYDNDLYEKLSNDFINYDAYVNMRKFVKNIAVLRGELDKHK